MLESWQLCTLALAGVVIWLTGSGFAAHGRKSPARKVILLTAFGASESQSKSALDHIEQRAGAMFPGIPIRRAFTSRVMRDRRARSGQRPDSPETALARLMDEGYTQVAVLSLHVIAGIEFHDLVRNVRLFTRMQGGIEQVQVARPLLSSHEDMVRVAGVLLGSLRSRRKPDEALILVGHGSPQHPSDAVYLAMYQVVQDLDPQVFVGTLAGHLNLPQLLPKLAARQIRRVFLLPLMAVAGGHVRNDVAGEQEGSWKTILEKNGYACEVVLKGMIEYPEVVEIWLDHLGEVLRAESGSDCV
jgi:sirohydrochlorin cobaltochelatase